MHRFRIGLLLIATLVTVGCDRGEKLGRVFGTVTYKDQPITAGVIVFSNPQAGVHMTADLKPDGTYELQTANGFGLPLGTYKVAVNPPVGPPTRSRRGCGCRSGAKNTLPIPRLRDQWA
ncbi:hypothetical protein [Aeoliella mucimassa]|uniref:Carboxypeptidase regulatory-like domain-containing protein n=1 Tax=Aeoliella mucimassa TaxID=2527972 RepID=A0A518APH6_9BACT|nr:hypothetical protein [Aeoliella mucimassa]QDU56625.1 hypothetical protein Pan181_28350 [Aeoliella mucimassa]